jgi:5'-3' exonuclease
VVSASEATALNTASVFFSILRAFSDHTKRKRKTERREEGEGKEEEEKRLTSEPFLLFSSS